MKRITLLTTLVATGLLVAPIAQAQGRAPGPFAADIQFSELDSDGNGTLTAEEFASARQVMFNRADTDGNGELSKEELIAAAEAREAARKEARIERMIERADADGNGTVSAEEMASFQPGGDHRGKRMEKRGGDHERGDRAEKRGDRAEKRGERAEKRGERAEQRGDRAQPTAEEREAKRAERMQAFFDRVDTNDDGEISEQEFETAKAFLGERRGGGSPRH